MNPFLNETELAFVAANPAHAAFLISARARLKYLLTHPPVTNDGRDTPTPGGMYL